MSPAIDSSALLAVAPDHSGSSHAIWQARMLWIDAPLGTGGLSWLSAWTFLKLQADCRPALWIDTHRTLVASELSELEDRLVVVRPADPRESLRAAQIGLKSGSFALVAVEMHRHLHPADLANIERMSHARSDSQLILWGEPPPFLSPPRQLRPTPIAIARAVLERGKHG